MPLTLSDMTKSKMDELPIVSYMVKEARGREINQKNYYGYLAEGDTWIDVHLSQVRFEPGNEAMLKSFLEPLCIDRSPEPSDLSLTVRASHHYRRKEYEKAAQLYEKALNVEKKGYEWSQRMKRVAIDQMGMAFGISGHNKKAKKIFQEAIKDDPEYPMYHYNLACAFAELGKVKKAAPELKRAFELRDNMGRGESLPNPRTDSSFRPHLDDPAMKKALEEIEQMKSGSGG